jgi:RelA/SpoT family (p)ppGpp synthetase
MKNLASRIKTIREIESAKKILFEFTDVFLSIQEKNELLEVLDFTIKAHDGQFRKGGEPYVIHPILVATITSNISNDPSMIKSALLHDVVEDTKYTLSDIKQMFGEDVAYLVDGLTKISEIRAKELPSSSSSEKLLTSAMSFRKLLLASTKDIRILFVKLCDRLHNLLTLDALPEHKQLRISEESLVVFAPIAHRLGISSIKNLIEDLSFKYLYPTDYFEISDFLEESKETLESKMRGLKEQIEKLLLKNGFLEDEFKVFGRVKHKYSIYLKMHKKGISIDEVLDLLALRILVKNPVDTYRALGIIHMNFKPLAFRFKDYVSIAKENGYQTLHTTIFNKEAIFEVQIRTYEMHKTAEYGLAAHWKYKKSETLELSKQSVNVSWLEDLSKQNEQPVAEFCDIFRGNLYAEDITIFSPTSETFTMPLGSVALDFAYKIHSEIGDNAVKAFVNKEEVSLLTELKNGDIVRIEIGKKPILRCSWIDSLKTLHAKKILKHNCNTRLKEINKITALNILSTVLKLSKRRILNYLEKRGLIESLSKVPEDIQFFKQIINIHIDEIKKEKRFYSFLQQNRFKLKEYKHKNLKIHSNTNISDIEFDYCCHPKKGDQIVGLKTGDKVTVHHKMCSRANEIMTPKDINTNNYHTEMVFIEWEDSQRFKFNLIASLSNYRGALAEFLSFLAKENIDILSIELGNKSDQLDFINYCEMTIETKEKNSQNLKKVLEQKTKIIELISLNDAYKK